ncbi:bcl-2-like protein 13 [Polypterus senegalus]|uniref:bcl-2-like protein 13 n=1 Tax=Polypterus senegalus TaxID=55291 RepID=UPI0019652F6A|nr:bcl-2-like protein 13 [Polypterus senegalus]XP_039626003.1 bcl-2-like protein 13 [Polypterus senegalus]
MKILSTMATVGVPEGFHFETKYVILSYLGLLSIDRQQEQQTTSVEGVQIEKEIATKVKADVEEELKLLEEEISKAFTSTGFDCHTSPVFNPANPESSIEDCLAHLGGKVCQEMSVHLHAAKQTLLSLPLDYAKFKETVQGLSSHSQGWNKVLVPLVLLQELLKELTRQGEQPLNVLLQYGVQYVEDSAADFIIQQGGWGTVFSLEEDEDQGAIAEDSNDIYILTSDNSGQVSPPESLTVTTSWQSESLPVSLSASQSWHTETLPVSLGPESWAQVGMDPEDVKSLDSGGAEERSENNSSNSDIVHVDKEEIAEEESAVSVAEVLEVHEAILKSEVETQELSSLELVKEAILSQAEVVPAVPAIVEESASEILLPPSTQEIPVIEKLAEKPPVKTEEPPKPAAVVRPVSEPDKPVLKPKTEEPLVEKAPDVVLTQTEKILKTSLKESGKETPIPPEDPVKIIESPVGEKPAQAPKDMTILYGGAAIAALAVAVVVMLVLRKK